MYEIKIRAGVTRPGWTWMVCLGDRAIRSGRSVSYLQAQAAAIAARRLLLKEGHR